jgi:hypothetical protein
VDVAGPGSSVYDAVEPHFLGEIQPFLALFHERVVRKLGVKDTRRFDEKSLKLMLMTFLSLSRMFHLLSEKDSLRVIATCSWVLRTACPEPGSRGCSNASISRPMPASSDWIAQAAVSGSIPPRWPASFRPIRQGSRVPRVGRRARALAFVAAGLRSYYAVIHACQRGSDGPDRC